MPGSDYERIRELEEQMSRVWKQYGVALADPSSPECRELEDQFNELATRRFNLITLGTEVCQHCLTIPQSQ